MSIAYATRLGLGPTNPGTIIVAQETLLFRWTGFSPVLWLLIPAFSLDNAPPDLTVRLQRRYQRSSTTRIQDKTYSLILTFHSVLAAERLDTDRRSTSL
jgi:hypothetical protein